MPGVNVIHVSENEIRKLVDERKPWEDVKPIPGVLKTHSMVSESEGCVSLYTY